MLSQSNISYSIYLISFSRHAQQIQYNTVVRNLVNYNHLYKQVDTHTMYHLNRKPINHLLLEQPIFCASLFGPFAHPFPQQPLIGR